MLKKFDLIFLYQFLGSRTQMQLIEIRCQLDDFNLSLPQQLAHSSYSSLFHFTENYHITSHTSRLEYPH